MNRTFHWKWYIYLNYPWRNKYVLYILYGPAQLYINSRESNLLQGYDQVYSKILDDQLHFRILLISIPEIRNNNSLQKLFNYDILWENFYIMCQADFDICIESNTGIVSKWHNILESFMYLHCWSKIPEIDKSLIADKSNAGRSTYQLFKDPFCDACYLIKASSPTSCRTKLQDEQNRVRDIQTFGWAKSKENYARRALGTLLRSLRKSYSAAWKLRPRSIQR